MFDRIYKNDRSSGINKVWINKNVWFSGIDLLKSKK